MRKEQNNDRTVASERTALPAYGEETESRGGSEVGRRSFLKGLGMVGATLLPASALLATKARANPGDNSGSLTRGDAAILRFLAAAELLESDLWEQYWELGGNQQPDSHLPIRQPASRPRPLAGTRPIRTAF